MGKSRSRAKKKEVQGRREAGAEDPTKHQCVFCNCVVPNEEGPLFEHYNGKNHKRLEKLHLYAPFFHEEGLIRSTSLKTYECTICKTSSLPVDVKKLKSHLLNIHFKSHQKLYPTLLSDLQEWYKGGEEVHVIQKVQKVRPKTYWVHEYDFESESRTYEKITAPVFCVDSVGCSFHFLLVNARFSSSLLDLMIGHAAFLEAEGNPTKRGEMKRSKDDSKIVSFGFRYAYGDIGRFRHTTQGCYKRADELCSMVSDHLKQLFPTVFDHLESILQEEGITDEDNVRLGNSPFTTMSITCDYNCNIHIDADDVSYGFFVWFGAHGTKDKYGNEVHFYLPRVQLFTIPSIRDVFLCKAKDLVHCTKTMGNRGQYGIALYQKASFFRWFSILKSIMFIGTAVHSKLLNSWLASSSIEYD